MTIAGLTELIGRLRKKFPERVDASTLRELGIAPNNESYVLNTLKHVGVLDKDFVRTETARDLFVEGDDEFREGLAKLLEASYEALFELHGDAAWSISKEKLITFFRQRDKSSELVGKRQADTFLKLAELAGKRSSLELANGVDSGKRDVDRPSSRREPARQPQRASLPKEKGGVALEPSVSLAVRVEVNLPATSDQAVYDAIFRSIRKNLIDSDQP